MNGMTWCPPASSMILLQTRESTCFGTNTLSRRLFHMTEGKLMKSYCLEVLAMCNVKDRAMRVCILRFLT